MKPIRVGILGSGNVLWAYFQVLDRLIPRGLATVGPVCARRRETWESLRSKRPGIELVETVDGVLDSDVEIVVIITPPDSHAELARRALDRGKHVLVEKPLAHCRWHAQPIVDLARRRGLHLLCAPFVQLAPTFRALWTRIQSGAIGKIHSTRGLYGNAGSTWAKWYHDGRVGPLAEVGIYNLKSLTAVAGPVVEALAASATAVLHREIEGESIARPGQDVSHVILRHQSGALSSIVSSHAIQRYRRPGLEIYGTDGTANLLGDDWDPRGFEIWRNDQDCWEEFEAIEPTWLWADGLAELVFALREGRSPLHDPEHDLHLIDVIEACESSAREKRGVAVESRFQPLHLEIHESGGRHHLHDHTRPADEQ